MSQTLKEKAISSVGWSTIDTLARQGVQFGITLCLARLLSPSEFGVMGIMMFFISLAGIFVDGGFTCALVQKQGLTLEVVSSVFFFNVGMGVLASAVLIYAAPFIAAFYAIPLLCPLVRVMSLSFVINSLGAVQWALLSKELDFRTQMRIGLTASLISGSVAIILAYLGWGVWSLAVQALLSAFVSTAYVWFLRRWMPGMIFSVAAIRPLFRFGSFLMLSTLLDVVSTRISGMVIGKVYSVKDLGFYSRADSTRLLPSILISSIIERVTFPVFSAASADKTLLLRGIRKSVKTSMLLNIPAMAGLIVLGSPLIHVMYGEKWLPSVPFLQILAIAGLLWPLHVINLNYLKATGQSHLFFRIEVLKKMLSITALIATSPISILAMAWSQVIVGCFGFYLNAYFTGRQLGYTPLKQLSDLWKPALSAVVMSACISYIPILIAPPLPLLLGIQVVGGAAVFFISCRAFHFDAFSEVLHECYKAIKSKYNISRKVA